MEPRGAVVIFLNYTRRLPRYNVRELSTPDEIYEKRMRVCEVCARITARRRSLVVDPFQRRAT